MNTARITEQLNAYGFMVKSHELKFDKWASCKVLDSKAGKKSGGYIINTKLNLCSYKNHKTMETGSFPLDREKVLSWHDVKKAIRENERIQNDKYYQNALTAAKKYNDLPINANFTSAYLERKQVMNFGGKITSSGDYVIPLRSLDKKPDGRVTSYIRGLQTIKPDGTKLLEAGCEKKGNMHLIGFEKIFKNPELYTGKILVAEGYATAASLHMASGLPTVVAFDAGNLEPVMSKITQVYSQAEFFICADNDLKTEHKIGRNVGIEAALACKDKYSCKVMIPNFANIPNSEKLTDFNDLHVAVGLENISKNSKMISSYLSQQIPPQQTNTNNSSPSSNQISEFTITKTTTSNDVLEHYAKINPTLIESARQIGWITYKQTGFVPSHVKIDAEPIDIAKQLEKITGVAVKIDEGLTKSSQNQRSIN